MNQYAPARPASTDELPRSPRHRSWRRPGPIALWIFTVAPFGLALFTAVRTPKMHVLLDYWHVLAKITDDNGDLLFGQVFTYHLDQPFVLPSLLFWADAAWFGGDNRILTMLTVLLVAGIVACLYSMLPNSLSTATKAVVLTGFSWILFSSHAAELWLQGTNGISWIPAVFFCVLAIACAHRGLTWAAGIAATLGCLSFGAALPIWFVLALIAWLRKDSRLRVLIPGAIGVLVVAAWFLTKPSGQQSLATSSFDLDGRLSVFAAALGGLWSADVAVVAVIAGGITIAALVHLGRVANPRTSGWIAIAAYAVLLAGMLALGRTTAHVAGGNVGLISRYVIVGALATSALLALVAINRPQWPLRQLLIATVTIALVTHAIGGTKAERVRHDYSPLNLAAIALRVDAPTVLDTLHIQRAAAPAARSLGAYPFNDTFTLGCGGPELGSHLPSSAPLPHGTDPGDTRGETGTPLTGDTVLSGWTTIGGARADCILVVDQNDIVIGGGLIGLPSSVAKTTTAAPEGMAWQAVAPPGATIDGVIAVKNGSLYRLQPQE
ncbi:hypothetical protein SAMN04489729_1550 [Amycolatopsis lurida]|uniref:DUF2079 domain-containing protein n=1 Tax=Amycolatopsis lurida NRRL 2430 TaxID=1460371 RepID=A0A2P2FZ85_AMYLU|nr:hypothetical protein [Amycolatopsis lurida]KFU82040.1 hypothetical protein BB31_06770 [Amycolatopsis lurida NRRL 2430]SEC42913.1 hypothetical protein SAMN04489729_1550 [Amycolatopsis lurida]